MKIKYFLPVLCGTALIFASCGSTKVDETPVETESEVSESIDETADTTNNNSQTEVGKIEDLNKAWIAKVEEARNAAISVNAQKYYADLFKKTDSSFDKVKSENKKKPQVSYETSLKNLQDLYLSMERIVRAMSLKEKVDVLDSKDIDQKLLEKAKSAMENYNSGKNLSGKDLLEHADVAYNSYFSLLNKGFMAMMGRERRAALSAKKDAESMKAQVAKKTKEQYKLASNTFRNADKDSAFKKYESAFNGYKSSKEAFSQMFEIVKKDRAETEAKLAAAKQKVLEAEQAATKADGEAPLTEKVAGIEDESTKLLEDDKFANPNDSINDVESGDVASTAAKIAEDAILAEENSSTSDAK